MTTSAGMELAKRLRAATMGFDWSDLPDDALVPAVPLLREAAAFLSRPVDTLPLDRETLGRMVREAWVRWARTQPDPKPSWLVPYDELSEPDKEADRQIGEAIAKWTVIHYEAKAALAARIPEASVEQAPEDDGLEHCGNFSATDPITDEDRIDYWKGAYERMASRNIRLNNALKQIRDQHIPDQPPIKPGPSVDRVVRQYENLRCIAKDAVDG